jgi:tetratricopeptide (TPR) repeat protein
MRQAFLFALLAHYALALPPQTAPREVAQAKEAIRQQRYNDAITRLEQTLEERPAEPQALEFMGAAVLYSERNFTKAQKLFEQSFQAGGGAAFWVSHSHEALGSDELADYCRGWLFLRKGEVEFAPENSEHGFRLSLSDLKEFKQNRFRRLFHLKDGDKTYNFRPRTGDENEVLLILILAKKFSR